MPDGFDCEPLHALSSAVLAVAERLSVREVLQRIVSSARSLLNAEYAALGVPDERGSFAEFVADGVSDAQWRAIGPVPRQHGLLGVMLTADRPQRLTDIRTDPRFAGWPAAHPILRDFLGVPIIADGRVLGAIYLANKRTGERGFNADDEKLAVILAAHAAIALTNARLYERNRELSVVEERHRLARDLHDAVAQKLFSLRLVASAAAEMVETAPERARVELGRVQELAAEALRELRSVIWEIRPGDLAGDGLEATLRKHVEVLDRIHGATVRWRATAVPTIAAERAEMVLRVAQEALHNALRHGDPRVIKVTLEGTGDGGLRLTVADDGAGFTVPPGGTNPGIDGGAERDGAEGAGRGLGLASMAERVATIGGQLTVDSTPGRGTTVRLEVPRDQRS